MSVKHILVLGAGGAAANGFTRALQMVGRYVTYGTNCSDDGLALAETDYTYPLPHANDPGYRKALLDLCETIRPDLVHAQNDEEVYELSLLRLQLPVFLPCPGTIRICQNKWYSHVSWRGHVPQPDTQILYFPAELESMLGKHGQVWLRNIRGAGGNGSIATGDLTLAKAWVERHKGWGQFTAAEMLGPHTATYTALYKDGELIVGQGRRREAWAYSRNQPSGVSGITGVGITTNCDELASTANKAIWRIDRCPHGLYGVDCAIDDEGQWNPTEINIGRFHTTVPEFFARAGLNIADLYCRAFFNEPLGKIRQLDSGRRWVRLMDRTPVLL